MNNDSLVCNVCEKKFFKRPNLLRHLRRIHNQKVEAVNIVKCHEEDCNHSFRFIKFLREHLQTAHGKEMVQENLYFPSMEEFNTWKQIEEKDNNCYFVLHSGGKAKNNCFRYYCNRTGSSASRNPSQVRKRHKAQGSCKINAHCTASMVVTQRKDNVSVLYHKTHYNHGMELVHIPMNELDKVAIVEMLNKDLKADQILDNIRESGSSLRRIHLATRKDIRNIEQSLFYKSKTGALQAEDETPK